METLEGSEILRSPLPATLTRKGYQTNSSALHKSHFKGKLGEWNIATEVRRVVTDGMNEEPLSARMERVSKHPCSIEREHYICGDEQSICGRYVQNALVPATAVGFANLLKIRFGDFKICEESKGEGADIPDFVGVYCSAFNLDQLNGDDQPAMRVVGEAKTPWVHSLRQWHTKSDQGKLRHALGTNPPLFQLFPGWNRTTG